MDKYNKMNCGDETLNFAKRHTGKIATFLGVMGVASSILISSNLIVASGVVLGITNLAIIAGGIVFEKIQSENDKVNSENESLKIYNKRLSDWKMKTESEFSTSEEIENIKEIKDNYDSIFYGLNVDRTASQKSNIKNTPDTQ